MQSICTTYTTTKVLNKHHTAYNIVRHVMLVVTIHSCIQPDDSVFKEFKLFCDKCAEAMAIFRVTDLPTLMDKEKAYTREAADKCLEILESMESIRNDHPDASPETFHVQTSVLPDAIFQELAEFIADEIPLGYKRTRHLRKLKTDGAAEINSSVRPSDGGNGGNETIPGLTSVVP